MRGRRRPAGATVTSLSGMSLRSLRARPLRSLLTAGAIVLGVGMVFGVLLLVGTIHSTFKQLFDSIYGKTDVVVSGQQSAGTLPTSTIERVRAVPGVKAASGNVGSIFRTVDSHGKAGRSRSAQLFTTGVDQSQPEMSSAESVAGRKPIEGRYEIRLDKDWAREHHLHVGGPVRLSTPTGVRTLRVSGLYTFPGGLNLGGYGTAEMAIGDARRVMDKPAGWDEISVQAASGVRPEALRDRISAALGRGVEVATPATKNKENQEQLASLDVVLYFFSGIALFVGTFLILNSFNMTVLQRMRELGTLRALGAGPTRIVRTILTEGVLLAVVGSVFGLALGAALAVLLLKAIQGFGMPVSGVHYSAGAAVEAVLAGLLATMIGAAWPAVRAGRVAPVRALIGGIDPARATSPWRAAIGLVLFIPSAAAGGLLWFGTNSNDPLVGIGATASTMAMFVGMVLLAPFVILPLVRLMAYPLRRVMPAEGRLAADAAQTSPGRTAATAATLLIALSVVVVNATVASSFVGSVEREIDRAFGRDLTVQPIGYQEAGPPQAGLSTRLRGQIAALPQVGTVTSRRALFVHHLPGGGSQGMVVGYDPYQYRRVDRVEYTGAPVQSVLRGLAAGGVVPAKSYAKQRGLHVGGRLRLEGPSGVRDAPIVGIADTLEMGGETVQMSLATIAAVYGVTTDSQLIVKASSPQAREALTRRVDALLEREYPDLEALSQAEFKKHTTEAINQQFSFFNAIVAIAVVIGVLGIINTLSMSVLERTREIGVLRALGASRWRVRRTMGNESLLISLAGTVSGILAGLGIGVMWILGMRATTFPEISLFLPLSLLGTIAVLGVAIGVLAAILPARRAAKLQPLAALRYE
ncbi:MAG TPA: FtsX-like permease family protein [Solirubrobacteraceae bacterium]|nr:FtsX-like permease family protein [Solirubrobacteraceae bacterium]